MSNVHGIRDDPLPNPNARYQQQGSYQGQGANPGGPPNQSQPPPRQQGMGGGGFMMGAGGGGAGGSMYPPINKVLAPNFTAKSFIFFISIVQLIVFASELIVGQLWFCGAFVTGNEMAGPSTECLKWMGGKYLPCIQGGEVWRFITPALLHAGILHIFTNLVSQTMIGYTCELHWGMWRMAAFYVATAIGATLLSCVGSPYSVSVGASGALLGIIGAYMAWILLNWNNRHILPQPCPRMCTMITWLFIIFMIGISMSGIDNLAHLGGFLSGLMLGFGFNTATTPVSWMQNRIKPIQITFIALAVCYFIALILCTFLAIDVEGECWGDLPTCS